MNLHIESATAKKDSETGIVGQVQFTVEGHPRPYEITLFSKNGRNWEYGLHFAEASGSESLIDAVEQYLEESDEAFDTLVERVLSILET